MKNQQVSVDYWAMGKAMFVYVVLTGMCWLMLRLFNAVFMLPRRLRNQQENIQNTLMELQKRFPDLNITEEDLLNAEKELEELTKESDDKENKEKEDNDDKETEDEAKEPKQIDITEITKEEVPQIEDKKTI